MSKSEVSVLIDESFRVKAAQLMNESELREKVSKELFRGCSFNRLTGVQMMLVEEATADIYKGQ